MVTMLKRDLPPHLARVRRRTRALWPASYGLLLRRPAFSRLLAGATRDAAHSPLCCCRDFSNSSDKRSCWKRSRPLFCDSCVAVVPSDVFSDLAFAHQSDLSGRHRIRHWRPRRIFWPSAEASSPARPCGRWDWIGTSPSEPIWPILSVSPWVAAKRHRALGNVDLRLGSLWRSEQSAARNSAPS